MTAAERQALALDVSDLDEVEGWTLAAVTTVVDDFEGCDFEKAVRFENGWRLVCSDYSYTYAYRPEAAIFVRKWSYEGRDYWIAKVLIEDEFYDMEPVPAK